MKQANLIGGMVFAVLTSAAGSASASITTATTIGFESLGGASVAGTPNLTGTTTNSAGNKNTYLESGIRFGIASDPLDTISHLHKLPGTDTGIQLQYHSDSSGIYFRASDDTAFSVWGMDFHAGYDAAENPHTSGAGDYWDIYGFSNARNPGLLTSNVDDNGLPTDANTGYPTSTAIAHAQVANGFDGVLDLLSLDSSFASVSAVWIHYHGYPHSPNAYIQYDAEGNALTSAYQFAVEVDNISLNAAGVVPVVAPVPVPAAVWMFGTGLLGMFSFGRKKA